jgi:hypothetical protein
MNQLVSLEISICILSLGSELNLSIRCILLLFSNKRHEYYNIYKLIRKKLITSIRVPKHKQSPSFLTDFLKEVENWIFTIVSMLFSDW